MPTVEASQPVSESSKARELRSLMPDDRRERSYAISLGIFFLNLLVYVATFALMFVYDQPFLNIVASVLNGMVIGLLFIVGHDACHGSFTPSARINQILARLAFLPSLQPYTSWAYSHNGLHHGWSNLKGKDVVFVPFTLAEYQALSWGRRLLERIHRTAFGVGLMYLTQIWWKTELFPAPLHSPKDKTAFFLDRLLVAAFLVVQIGAALLLSFTIPAEPWYLVLRAVLLLGLSYAAWFLLIGVITFQQHTHPEVPWYDKMEEWNFYRAHIHSTPHLLHPTWLRRLLHNIMDHNAHHVDPLIPLYQLNASQHSLEDSCGRDVVTNGGSIRAYLKTLRICRLYDYEKHQWTDYDGTPTSAPGLNLLTNNIDPRQDNPSARVP